MARMRPPIIPEQPVPIVPADGLRRLLAVCAGRGFEARRDTAIIMLLLDTGGRRAELADLQVVHIDLDLDVLLVLGKGRRERALPFGHQAGEALERYLRVRARHKHADLPWLWIGLKGHLTAHRLVMMLRRRGRQAGLPELHPHQFRHTFAHQWLAEGGGETDLMRLAGWSRGRCSSATARRLPSPRPRGSPAVCLPPTASEAPERFLKGESPGSCGEGSRVTWWPRPGAGQRAHPILIPRGGPRPCGSYQQSRAQRCADRRFLRSRASVRGEVMRS
jgi:hypothetical protein